ncbi:helix-turn-helix domain-containing protein [Oceanicella sp. SM1341]|uniref:helix-turn-helix domain-containing protein n=1 Tax=Oceanicella sp. SM1341 TaxID=1548889 RepID=UPI0018E563B0|nr:AraC family transcriptional regulator [Oceanicella sp. SM1341]
MSLSVSAPPAAPRGARAGAGLAPWQLRRVAGFIEDRLSERITVADLAAQARLSRAQFFRAFTATLGMPPHGYVMARRLRRAEMLMLTTSEPLSRISAACGLADQAHLTRLFRCHAGTTPHRWRRRHRAPGG